MNINIIDKQRHRNGVSGTPFTVYLIEDKDSGDTKVAIKWGTDEWVGDIAVLSVDLLAKGDIGFGSNSWRGDNYGHAIKKIEDAELTNSK